MRGRNPDIWPLRPTQLDPAQEHQISARLSRLSLEQKVGQMIQAEIAHVSPQQVRDYHLGAILNGGGSFPNNDKHAPAADWLALADDYWQAAQDSAAQIPILWGTDAVHGHNNLFGATLFPHNIGLGAARNPELVEQAAAITAREVCASGIDWAFAPTLAVARDLRWGRTYESYAEDPEILEQYAAAAVRGLQGAAGHPGFLGTGKVIATAKHFIGDGGTHGGQDQGDNRDGEQDLFRLHGRGYLGALAAGVQTVMASFSSWHGQKMHAHKYLLTDILKHRLGFCGFVVSDWDGFAQVDPDLGQACKLCIEAGIDMLLVAEDWQTPLNHLLALVRSGALDERRVDEAVRRILRVKLRAGLFQKGKPSSRLRALDSGGDRIGCAAHRRVARQAVRESLVLLKNKNGLLPLRPDRHTLVAGAASDMGRQTGGWTLTWQGDENKRDDFPGATSITEGIQAQVQAGGGRVTLNESGDCTARPDCAVIILGEDPYAEGQGDRTHLSFSATQPQPLALLRRLKAQGIPVVALFLSGRPLWINPELNAADAFVAAWLPGSEGGGLSDLLFADRGAAGPDFVGRLTYSWPATPTQCALHRGGRQDAPLFPYGYGLSYRAPATSELPPGLVTDSLPEEDPAAQRINGDLLVFRGKVVPPFKMFVGEEGHWKTPVQGRHTESPNRSVRVQSTTCHTQEDARRICWQGDRAGQVYFQSPAAQPLRAGAVLSLRMRVERYPEQDVLVRMDAGYPRMSAPLGIRPRLLQMPLQQWQELTLPLADFTTDERLLERVDTPFLLWTAGPLQLSIAELKICAPS